MTKNVIPDGDYIRFSALDRIAVCTASWYESKGKPSIGSEAANFGTAGHRIYEVMTPLKRFLTLDECRTIAAFHGVGERAKELHDAIKNHGLIPQGLTEHSIEMAWDDAAIPMLKGTLDNAHNGKVRDFKFSQLRGNMPLVGDRIQVPGYSWIYAILADLQEIEAEIVNPLMGPAPKGVSTCHYNREEIEDGVQMLQDLCWSAARQERLPRDKRSYTPSEHCVFCPGRITCPAVKAQLQAVATIDSAELSIDIERLPALVQFAKDLTKRAAAVVDFAKATVKLTGDITGPDGLSLVMTKMMRKPSVSAKALYEWLETHDHADLVMEMRAEFEDRPKVEIPVMNVKKLKKEIAADV